MAKKKRKPAQLTLFRASKAELADCARTLGRKGGLASGRARRRRRKK